MTGSSPQLPPSGSSHGGFHQEGSDSAPNSWAARWSLLGRPVEVTPTTPVAIALSGGADSVYLLTMIARSVPRPKALAIHVDHGLRGDESRADAEFCARLCAKLGIPFARRMVELDPEAGDLEARARQARYKALTEEASAAGISVLLTGHHEDDAVETLLMRWMRGTEMPGLAGLRRETVLGAGAFASDTSSPMRVIRPLVGMRREEVRSALRREGIQWRDDLSNASDQFSRGRVRAKVLPEIAAQCGDEGVDNLRAFAKAVESFEDEIADRTAHITWDPVVHEAARRSASMPDLGGSIRREALGELSPPLMQRALGRLIGEGTGQRPARRILASLAEDVSHGRNGRRELHDGWTVQLQSDAMHLTPPSGMLSGSPNAMGGGAAVAEASAPAAAATQPRVRQSAQTRTEGARSETMSEVAPSVEASAPMQAAPEPTRPATAPLSGEGLALGLPGTVQLPDGRSIHATLAAGSEAAASEHQETTALIDADGLGDLRVRFSKPGDRFQGLGAPGHKPLRRFLGDLGIPREERGNVPLVVSATTGEIVWVAGVRIAESRRVRASTRRTLKLSLHGVRER